MSLFSVFEVSGSGLSAQTLRLNTVSSNLANADSISRSEKDAYRSRQPVFSQLVNKFSANKEVTGVKVLGIVESKAAVRSEYRPDHPMADENGKVYFSNVNSIEEMANMISASRSYQNNIEVMNTSKQLLLRTLTMGQ
ncbi:MAG: flagellar basal body rod protein FlgC [Gammaproteobacteria bacterium]|nr:MAG: flagellar basal body rod protein FlgC [Gammaproteobacteria bacterium]